MRSIIWVTLNQRNQLKGSVLTIRLADICGRFPLGAGRANEEGHGILSVPKNLAQVSI